MQTTENRNRKTTLGSLVLAVVAIFLFSGLTSTQSADHGHQADQKAAEDYQKALTAYKANKKARDEAWVRWKKLLAAI